MKPVDSVAFQKIKSPKEGNNDESNNFEMEILDEGAPDKFLWDPENFWPRKPQKKIYVVIYGE